VIRKISLLCWARRSGRTSVFGRKILFRINMLGMHRSTSMPGGTSIPRRSRGGKRSRGGISRNSIFEENFPFKNFFINDLTKDKVS